MDTTYVHYCEETTETVQFVPCGEYGKATDDPHEVTCPDCREHLGRTRRL